jgi:hypothetical protein
MSRRLLRLALGQDAVLASAHLRVGLRPLSFVSFLLEIAVRFALLRARPTRGYSSGIGRGPGVPFLSSAASALSTRLCAGPQEHNNGPREQRWASSLS